MNLNTITIQTDLRQFSVSELWKIRETARICFNKSEDYSMREATCHTILLNCNDEFKRRGIKLKV